MDEEKRDTVVVDNGERSNPIGWIIALVILVLAILFLFNGGFGLFNGGNGNNTTTTKTPNTTKVQPDTAQ